MIEIRLTFLGRFLWFTRWKPLPFSSRRKRQDTFIECTTVANSFCCWKSCSVFFLFLRMEASSSRSIFLCFDILINSIDYRFSIITLTRTTGDGAADDEAAAKTIRYLSIPRSKYLWKDCANVHFYVWQISRTRPWNHKQVWVKHSHVDRKL